MLISIRERLLSFIENASPLRWMLSGYTALSDGRLGRFLRLFSLALDEIEQRAKAASPAVEGSLQAFLDHAAAERIRTVLKDVRGARTETARRLGIDRTTLYRLMRKFGVSG